MQSRVVSSQLPVSDAMSAGQGPLAAPATRSGPAQPGTFASVLTAKMSGQKTEVRNSSAPGRRIASEEVCVDKGGLTRSKPEKQNAAKQSPIRTLPRAEIPSAPASAASARGNIGLQQDLNQVSKAGAASAKGEFDPLTAGPGGIRTAAESAGLDTADWAWNSATEPSALCRHNPAAIQSSETQLHESTQSAPSTSGQGDNAPDHPDETSCVLGDTPAPSLATDFGSPLESAAGGASDLPPGDAATATASTVLPNRLAPSSAKEQASDVPATVAEGDKKDTKPEAGPAARALEALSNASGRIAESHVKPELSAIPVPNLVAPCSTDGNPKRVVDAPNWNVHKSDASGPKSLQACTSEPLGNEQPRFNVSDATTARLHIAQAASAATSDGQDKLGAPPGALTPEVERANPAAANLEDGAPHVAAPTSSPTENASAPSVVLHIARVLERMGQSEMRVGLNSSDFGSLELHTHVEQDRVNANIVTDHTGLRAAMVAEMPSLEHGIAQHQLKLDSFTLDARTGGDAGDSGAAGGHSSSHGGWMQPANQVSEISDETPALEIAPSAWTASHSGGLNVQA